MNSPISPRTGCNSPLTIYISYNISYYNIQPKYFARRIPEPKPIQYFLSERFSALVFRRETEATGKEEAHR